jgi:hypothetical protein
VTWQFRPARSADADVIVDVVLGRLQWLQGRGLDQWSTRDQEAVVRANVRSGTTWVLEDPDQHIIGTMTMSAVPPEGLWTTTELQTPALYIAKLASSRGGAGVGKQLVACAGYAARKLELEVLRWDAWTTNGDLHRYYLALPDVRLVRVVADFASGALFELPVAAMTADKYPVEADLATLDRAG